MAGAFSALISNLLELVRIVELTRAQPEYCETEGHKLVHCRLFQERMPGGAWVCIPEDESGAPHVEYRQRSIGVGKSKEP